MAKAKMLGEVGEPTVAGLYAGVRHRDGAVTVIKCDTGERLNPRYDLRNHSPDGFEWGYGGSGPAQLALAILADYLKDDENALRLYQDFKWAVVARFGDNWNLFKKELDDAIKAIRNEEIQ